MPLPPPFPCALGSCGAWAMYCAQPPSTQTSHWVPTFPSNASAHIPHLGSAQCFSKQYLCPPHSLSFPLPSAWLPLHLLVSLLSFFAAHSSFPLPRCSTNTYQPPPRPTSINAGDIPSMAQADIPSRERAIKHLSQTTMSTRAYPIPAPIMAPHRSPTVRGSQHKMVWSIFVGFLSSPWGCSGRIVCGPIEGPKCQKKCIVLRKISLSLSFSRFSDFRQTSLSLSSLSRPPGWQPSLSAILFHQWPFQEPKLEVPTIYKAYVRLM